MKGKGLCLEKGKGGFKGKKLPRKETEEHGSSRTFLFQRRLTRPRQKIIAGANEKGSAARKKKKWGKKDGGQKTHTRGPFLEPYLRKNQEDTGGRKSVMVFHLRGKKLIAEKGRGNEDERRGARHN